MSPSTISRRLFRLAALLFLSVAGLTPALRAATGPMHFIYTYHQFAYDDTLTLVELNVQFSDHGLSYRAGGHGGRVGTLYTRFTFRDSLGNNPSVIDWGVEVPQSAAGSDPQFMLGSRLVGLRPGRYKAQVYYEDLADAKQRDSAEFDLDVRSFTRRGIQLSDIEIVTEAAWSQDTANQFYKNGYVVTPNVASLITPPFLVLNTYIELYNADTFPASDYKVRYMLADKYRNIFFEKEYSRPKTGAPAVIELNSLPLDSVPSGEYYIVVKSYADGPGAPTDTAVVFRSFTISNPDMSTMIAMGKGPAEATRKLDLTAAVIDPIYAGMREEELEEEYAKAKYIANEIEKELWDGLQGSEAKARFLSSFWSVRDLNPETPENEARDNYYKLVEEARTLYRAPMAQKGWDSDRGRILLQYGKPDGVERHIQDFNMRPYEIWHYSSVNYDFVFVDRSETGLYRLMHSTAPRERKYENWLQDYATMNKNN